MKLIRYNDPLSAQWRSLDQWFGGFPRTFNTLERLFDLSSRAGNRAAGRAGGGLPADLFEDSDNYYARLELPGVNKSEIRVALDQGLLTLGFDRGGAEDGRDEMVSVERSLTVPEGIDGDKVSAKLEDGILTVTLPKAEQRKPRSITVN